MSNKDFIPDKERDFFTWINNLLNALNVMISRSGFAAGNVILSVFLSLK
jgi:hypothetical protein